MTGFVPEVFGRLTTLDAGHIVDFGTYRKKCHMVRCVCGTVKQVHRAVLLSGHTQSCGCLKKDIERQRNRKHGQSPRGAVTTEYRAWRNMLTRCYNVNNTRYKDYGGRGIGVFSEWQGPDGFQKWYAYMGERPGPDYSIDRFPDNNGNYEPGNVRWATTEEQQGNTRANRFLSHIDKTQTVAQWARELGIRHGTLKRRLQLGWSPEKALTTPVQENIKKKVD